MKSVADFSVCARENVKPFFNKPQGLTTLMVEYKPQEINITFKNCSRHFARVPSATMRITASGQWRVRDKEVQERKAVSRNGKKNTLLRE